MPPRKHQELMTAAVARDGVGLQALLAGDLPGARAAFAQSAELYRQSWEAAHPTAYGRLVGMMKSAVLAGGGGGLSEAGYVRDALADAPVESVTAAYARALAALIVGSDEEAAGWAARMTAGGDAFARTGEAITALARGDRDRYERAMAAIVLDFEERPQHLTGVAVADTALVLREIGARRGMTVAIESPVLPGSVLP